MPKEPTLKTKQAGKAKALIVGMLLMAIILGAGINTSSKVTSVSPCILPLPVPCSEELDKIRVNYSQQNFGFPATYKKTVTSERIQPQPYMTTTLTPVAFNPLLLLLNVAFWFLLFDFVARLLYKHTK